MCMCVCVCVLLPALRSVVPTSWLSGAWRRGWRTTVGGCARSGAVQRSTARCEEGKEQ